MSNDYTFTEDWFSINIPAIKAIFEPTKINDYPIDMLEVGCFEGRSTVWFLENILRHPQSTITCLDTFQGSLEHTEDQKNNLLERFQKNLIPRFSDKVKIMVGPSVHGLRTKEITDNLYTVIYIDGDHRSVAVLSDAVMAFPLLKLEGVMIFDDYLGGSFKTMFSNENPHNGIEAFMNIYKDYIEVLNIAYCLIIKKTKNFY